MKTNSLFDRLISIFIAIVIIAGFIQIPCVYSIYTVIKDLNGDYSWISPKFFDFWTFFIMPTIVLSLSVYYYSLIIKKLATSIFKLFKAE